MSELKLTSSHQSLLAEICATVAGVVRAAEAGDEITPAVAEKIVDRIIEVADQFGATSQVFGALYDKLHRTGANQ